jgi:hypothetical protein
LFWCCHDEILEALFWALKTCADSAHLEAILDVGLLANWGMGQKARLELVAGFWQEIKKSGRKLAGF